jgi:thiamine-phosphate diphosphorylase
VSRPGILCLVTDRHRLVKVRGAAAADWRPMLLEQIEGAVAGGVDLVQIRERDLEARVLTELVDDVLRITKGHRTKVLVNDRIDIALAAGADGVHLREDSLSTSAARGLAPPGFLISRAVHRVTAAASDALVDYLIAGTVAGTVSKPGGVLLGLDGLRRVVEATDRSVLAIGGVTASNAGLMRAAGAAGIAAIGAFVPESDIGLSGAVQILAKNLRFAFDTAGLRP